MQTTSTPPAAPVALGQFCKTVGVSKATVWKWRKAGWLATVNIGGRVFVTPEGIAEFNRRAHAGDFTRSIRPPLADRAK